MFKYEDITDASVLTSILKRDPKHILAHLKTTPDGKLISDIPLDIIYPNEYIEKGLMKYSSSLECLGIFAIVDPVNKKYALHSIPARVPLASTMSSDFTYQDKKYMVLHYRAFETIFDNVRVISDDKISYWIYDYFIALGRIPWYMNYEDVLKLYDLDKHFIGKLIAPKPTILELIASITARNPNNDRQLYRHLVKDVDDLQRIPPKWTPLKNVTLGAVDTFSKVMGSYFEEGMTSAIADNSDVQTEIEKVLRM